MLQGAAAERWAFFFLFASPLCRGHWHVEHPAIHIPQQISVVSHGEKWELPPSTSPPASFPASLLVLQQAAAQEFQQDLTGFPVSLSGTPVGGLLATFVDTSALWLQPSASLLHPHQQGLNLSLARECLPMFSFFVCCFLFFRWLLF